MNGTSLVSTVRALCPRHGIVEAVVLRAPPCCRYRTMDCPCTEGAARDDILRCADPGCGRDCRELDDCEPNTYVEHIRERAGLWPHEVEAVWRAVGDEHGDVCEESEERVLDLLKTISDLSGGRARDAVMAWIDQAERALVVLAAEGPDD